MKLVIGFFLVTWLTVLSIFAATVGLYDYVMTITTENTQEIIHMWLVYAGISMFIALLATIFMEFLWPSIKPL